MEDKIREKEKRLAEERDKRTLLQRRLKEVEEQNNMMREMLDKLLLSKINME
jgi:septal ring factor EnvC (AmiA/AmiB activator)